MENYLYFLVKSVACAYILHRVWRLLFGEIGLRFWRYLIPKQGQEEKGRQLIPKQGREGKGKPEQVPAESGQASVVGKSHTVYLKPEPVDEPETANEPEPTANIREEDNTSLEDVEVTVRQVRVEDILSEEERFEPFEGDFPPDQEFSTGMTYDEIANAVDVVMGKEKGEEARLNAARLLYEVRQTDMMEFFSTQAGNIEAIEQLLSENLDENGLPLVRKDSKQPADSAEDFDMDRYV